MATKITSGSIFSAGAVVVGVDADAPPSVPSPSPEPAPEPAPATAQILPLSRAVSLLMDASATADGSVVDSSTNSHPITVNGDVSQSSFSPYRSGGYSLYNTGTNHIEKTGLTAPGTGDFTIEAWVYVTNSSANQMIWDTRPTAVDNTTGINVQLRSNNVLYAGTANSALITGTTTFNDNEWVHVVLVRSGGTLTLYGNGVSQGSVSHSVNLTSTDINIGSNRSGASVFNGYISDLRVVNDTVYTGDFTPPTSRLTAIADTVLLTCNLPYLQSGLTVTGDVSPVAAGPYDYIGYSESLHGGSYVFDGSGDSLTIASDSSLYLDGDFTIEFWINNETIAIDTQHPSPVTFAGNLGQIYTNSSNNFYGLYYDTGDIVTTGNNTAKTGVWQHVAFTRSDSTCYAFVDGVLKNTATSSQAFSSSTGTFRIGSYNGTGGDVNGNMSDIRIVKGTAVYTTDFTPPTAPLTAVAGTSLLLSGNNASIRDESQSVESISVFGNTTVVDSSPYGTGKSIEFDGSTGYIWSLDHSGVRFNTGDFTAECWFKLDAFPYDSPNRTQAAGILGKRSSDFNSGAYWRIACHLNGTVSYQTSENGSSARLSSQNPVSLDTWYHIAVSRSAGIVTLYLNGVAQDSRACSDNLDYVGEQIVIGNLEGAYLLNGNVSDVRLVKGAAVYTENFSVPTAPLGDYSETVDSPEPAPSIVTEGLVFHVDAGDTSSYSGTGTTWSDLVGSNDATLVNGVGYDNGSMVFDGNDDYVTVPSTLTIGDTFTYSAWIKADSLSGRSAIFSTRNPNSGDGLWQLEVGEANGPNRVGISVPGIWAYNSSDNVISTNTWHHITVVKADASTNFEVFVDGVSQGSASVAVSTIGNNNTRVIGAGVNAIYDFFDGKMASIMMYNTALTAADIQKNIEATNPEAD